jgi:hypothetical protein
MPGTGFGDFRMRAQMSGNFETIRGLREEKSTSLDLQAD